MTPARIILVALLMCFASLAAADVAVPKLTGRVVDQAALHGLLHQLRDIGLPLVSLTQVETDQRPPHTTDTSRSGA